MLTPREAAIAAAKALDDKKAQDIQILKIADLTAMAEYFVIATGTSTTHIKTLAEEAERVLVEQGEILGHTEGYRSGSWVLLDFGSVIVHLFTLDTRKFYSLERLWSDATPIEFDAVL